MLRIIDEQDAINRYKWYNLPDGLDSHLLERVLYYKGQGVFFYAETIGKFYFLPYALSGNIDIYGRFNKVTPLPLTRIALMPLFAIIAVRASGYASAIMSRMGSLRI